MLRAILGRGEGEVASLLGVIVNARRKFGAFDLEALELARRTPQDRAGARLLEEIEGEGQPPLCTCGGPLRGARPCPKQAGQSARFGR